MNTHFKVFASYNILQYLCDFIHVLIFVNVSKCQKNPKLTNIVIIVHELHFYPIPHTEFVVLVLALYVFLYEFCTDLGILCAAGIKVPGGW